MNMSIILQIGASHFSSAVPNKGADADIANETGSESNCAEASSINCGTVSQMPTVTPLTTYPNCCGLPYQDHNYGAPPPPTPPQSPSKLNSALDEDTSTSVVTTSTTNEDDGPEEESVTRCICEFEHDDEYMICCDKCSVWQHVDCMGLDRNNIPETYMCEKCEPRKVDKQKAKALQTRKKGEMTADSSSDETGDENSELKSVGSKGKKIKQRRKEKVEEKLQTTPMKRVRRRIKERVEQRRPATRKRRKSKSMEVSSIDESTRDSWDSNIKEWMEKYEEAETNQYSPEVHLQVSNMKFNGQHEELARKVAEHTRIQLCHVSDISKTTKGLLATTEIRSGQIICECRGKFLLLSQFQQQNPLSNNRIHPFVLFYTLQKGQEEVCVDAREYGNDSRFVRRSCSPNSEIHHVIENGSLHLYIMSVKNILRNEEITIAFDCDIWSDDIECACMKTNCALLTHVKKNGLIERMNLERKVKKVKRSLVIEGDNDQTIAPSGSLSSTKTVKTSPLAQSNVQCEQLVDDENGEGESDSTQGNGNNLSNQTNEETETEEQASERRKKMTRDERKMEAIMKAFARLEKTQQRRQEALARLAHKKEELETKKKDDDKKPIVETINPTDGGDDVTMTPIYMAAVDSVQSGDETKPVAKIRKGKKRKNSGNPVRRRSLVSSGGSDILSPDENSSSGQISISTPIPAAAAAAAATSASAAAAASVAPAATVTAATAAPPLPPPPTVAPQATLELTPTSLIPVNNGFKFPKTKKLMMTEWFSESTETQVQPLTIKTELPDFTTASPTCYIRSARSPTGINQAHLRRSSGGVMTSQTSRQSSDSSMGSAKKRWLRQAMCEEVETTDQPSPFANGSLSPPQMANSPNTSPSAPDLVTPLKKRRLPRESVSFDMFCSSPPSTPSPSVSGQVDVSYNTGCQRAVSSVDEDEMQYESVVEPSDGCCVKELESETNLCVKDEVDEKFEIAEDETLNEVQSAQFEHCCTSAKESVQCDNSTVTSAGHHISEENSVSSDMEASTTLNSSSHAPEYGRWEHETQLCVVRTSQIASSSEECSSTEQQHQQKKTEFETNHNDVPGRETVGECSTSDVLTAADSSTERQFEVGTCKEPNVTTSNGYAESASVVESIMVVDDDFQVQTSTDLQPVEVMSSKADSSATSIKHLITPSTASVSCACESTLAVSTATAAGVAESNTSRNFELPNQGPVISSSASSTGVAEEVSTTHVISSTSLDNGSSSSSSSSSTSSHSSGIVSTSLLSTCTSGASQTTKRKVSLLEYRKRKMENQTSKSGGSNLSVAMPSTASSTIAVSSTVAILSPSDLLAPPQLSTLPLFQSGPLDSSNDKKDNQKRPENDPTWSNNPTTLEQQRENLTQRLRREFGLNTDEDSDADKEAVELVSMQNGRSVACCLPHPSGPQTAIVRTVVPAVQSIPTIIGITGYQPPPRVLHPPAPGTPHQYAYQQYPSGLYVPRQQFAPNSQVVTQYGTAPLPSQSTRPTLAIRPQMNALPQVTRTLVMGGQATSLPPYGEQVLPAMHVQPVHLTTRPSHPPPPILPPQVFHDTQYTSNSSSSNSNNNNNNNNNSSSSSNSSRQQTCYKQGYYK